MNQFTKYFSTVALLICATVQADNNGTGVSPTFVARSQARYKMREDVGVVDHTNLSSQDSWYGTFAVIPGYMQTFRSGNIAHTLFGNSLRGSNGSESCDSDCGSAILIQGSQFNNGTRTAGAWLADNFYLPSTFSGSFNVKPSVKDFFIDFDFYSGLDEWFCGGYFRVYAPFVHTRWNLAFCEADHTITSTVGYTQGYFDSVEVPSANLLQSFSEYAAGGTPALTAATSVKPQGLKFAKITKCKQTKNGLGDLRAELGWNFWQSDCYHLGLNIQAAAPTGTKRRAEFLFDAVVGNGHHWELGGGITGHYTFWSDESESRHFGVYLDANFTHLFKATEQRTFDLKGKPNSRYMLAAQLGANTQNLNGSNVVGGANPTLSKAQFTGVYTPVANLTTFDIKVSTGVQADVVAWFNYTSCNWSWDFGYNFYGRSKEKFACETSSCDTSCNNTTNICDESQKNVWVLKGDAREFGFTSDANHTPVRLAASENSATICSGVNSKYDTTEPMDPIYRGNVAVDNAQFAFGLSPLVELDINATQAFSVLTSIQPVYVKCEDVDFARTRSITNSVFTHVSYTWDCDCWTPYLGVGGFAEFGSNSSCNDSCNTDDGCGALPTVVTTSACDNNCGDSNSVNTSLSRWGVWLKGGVSFN